MLTIKTNLLAEHRSLAIQLVPSAGQMVDSVERRPIIQPHSNKSSTDQQPMQPQISSLQPELTPSGIGTTTYHYTPCNCELQTRGMRPKALQNSSHGLPLSVQSGSWKDKRRVAKGEGFSIVTYAPKRKWKELYHGFSNEFTPPNSPVYFNELERKNLCPTALEYYHFDEALEDKVEVFMGYNGFKRTSEETEERQDPLLEFSRKGIGKRSSDGTKREFIEMANFEIEEALKWPCKRGRKRTVLGEGGGRCGSCRVSLDALPTRRGWNETVRLCNKDGIA
ncbi:uncharacterized protein VTP21DRAFT_8039 [Calcarisporiella thermophila]|uniref:uncharacterized protein n=1 Tax=Calcarisporiella thermophila TaxID=911321 RepID=UPI003743B030